MFARFSQPAMQVIVRAQEEARALGHAWLGTEHLLLGVLAQPGQPGVSTLLDVGVTFDAAKAALANTIGTSAGLSSTDADALRILGSTWTMYVAVSKRHSNLALSTAHPGCARSAVCPGGTPPMPIRL